MTRGNQRGFSLIEILVVFGVMTIAASFALLVSMDAYRSTNFRTERNMLVALLERARSQAINNYCLGTCTDGAPHGVAIRPIDNPDKYILYQGATYATRDTGADSVFDANPLVTSTGFSEVSFAQLSAVSSTVGGNTLTLSETAGHSSVITIGSEGQISWTN